MDSYQLMLFNFGQQLTRDVAVNIAKYFNLPASTLDDIRRENSGTTLVIALEQRGIICNDEDALRSLHTTLREMKYLNLAVIIEELYPHFRQEHKSTTKTAYSSLSEQCGGSERDYGFKKYLREVLTETLASHPKGIEIDSLCKHLLDQSHLTEKEKNSIVREELYEDQLDLMALKLRKKTHEAITSFCHFLSTSNTESVQIADDIKRYAAEREENMNSVIANMKTFDIKETVKDGYKFIPDSVNIVLIGKTGNGKSSTGNTIIGTTGKFKAVSGTSSGTKSIQLASTKENNLTFNVMDTPGLFDTSRNWKNEETLKEIVRAVLEFPTGVHVFLIVCRCDVRFTQEEIFTIEAIERTFSSDVFNHCLLVVTRAGEFAEDSSLQKVIRSNRYLQNVFKKMSKRAIAVDNKDKLLPVTIEFQRQTLLCAICEVITKNKNQAFMYPEFVEMQKFILTDYRRLISLKCARELIPSLIVKEISKLSDDFLKDCIDKNNLPPELTKQIMDNIDNYLLFYVESSEIENTIEECWKGCIDFFKDNDIKKRNESFLAKLEQSIKQHQEDKNTLRDEINNVVHKTLKKILQENKSNTIDFIDKLLSQQELDKNLFNGIFEDLSPKFINQKWKETAKTFCQESVKTYCRAQRKLFERKKEISRELALRKYADYFQLLMR